METICLDPPTESQPSAAPAEVEDKAKVAVEKMQKIYERQEVKTYNLSKKNFQFLLDLMRSSWEGKEFDIVPDEPGNITVGNNKTSVRRYLTRKLPVDLPDAQIDEFGRIFETANSLPENVDKNIKLLSGKEITAFYKSSTIASCMTGVRSIYIQIYEMNPDKIQLVVLYKIGKPIARALLWTDDKGNKYMDRVYPEQEMKGLLYNWADGKGYATYYSTNRKRSSAVTIKHDGIFPSMDSFVHARVKGKGVIRLFNYKPKTPHFALNTTCGSHTSMAGKCSKCKLQCNGQWKFADGEIICYNCLFQFYSICDSCYRPIKALEEPNTGCVPGAKRLAEFETCKCHACQNILRVGSEYFKPRPVHKNGRCACCKLRY